MRRAHSSRMCVALISGTAAAVVMFLFQSGPARQHRMKKWSIAHSSTLRGPGVAGPIGSSRRWPSVPNWPRIDPAGPISLRRAPSSSNDDRPKRRGSAWPPFLPHALPASTPPPIPGPWGSGGHPRGQGDQDWRRRSWGGRCLGVGPPGPFQSTDRSGYFSASPPERSSRLFHSAAPAAFTTALSIIPSTRGENAFAGVFLSGVLRCVP